MRSRSTSSNDSSNTKSSWFSAQSSISADPDAGTLAIDYSSDPQLAAAATPQRFQDVLQSLSPVSSAQAAEAELESEAGRGNYSIQVGAFAAQEPAEAMAKRAADAVADLVPQDRVATPQLPAEDGPLYRARLVDLDEGLARQACEQLKANSIDCLVIRNGG